MYAIVERWRVSGHVVAQFVDGIHGYNRFGRDEQTEFLGAHHLDQQSFTEIGDPRALMEYFSTLSRHEAAAESSERGVTFDQLLAWCYAQGFQHGAAAAVKEPAEYAAACA